MKNKKKIIPVIVTAVVFIILALWQSSSAYAAVPQDRGNTSHNTDILGSFNYQFSSGADHRHELGRPTTFSGFVPVDISSVNMRRDANVSLRPPQYGVFSGHIPSAPVSRLFPQPTHLNAVTLNDPNIIAHFDTLLQGINAPPTGNPMNIQNVSAGEFLPPTSIR